MTEQIKNLISYASLECISRAKVSLKSVFNVFRGKPSLAAAVTCTHLPWVG